MQKWEYINVEIQLNTMEGGEFLNRKGKDGWELVAAIPGPVINDRNASYTRMSTCFFKRPLAE